MLIHFIKNKNIYLAHFITSIIFGIIYSLLLIINAKNFFINDKITSIETVFDKIFNGFYFSLITQTTIGFGDIVPLTKLSKLLVIIQVLSVFGIFYVYV